MKDLLNTKEKQAEAAECFKANSDVKEMHVTVDGMCFIDEANAKEHAESLCHDIQYKGHEKTDLKVVEMFKREDIEKPAKSNLKVKAEGEEIVLKKEAEPKKEEAPKKEAEPTKEEAPKKEAEPKKEEAPKKEAEPKKEEAPKKVAQKKGVTKK